MALAVGSFTANATWFSNADPTAKTVTVSWAAGDAIVVFGGMESDVRDFVAPTATGLTFTQKSLQNGTSGSEAGAGMWGAIAGASGTNVTVSLGSSGAGHAGLGVWVITGGPTSIDNVTGNLTESALSITVAAGDVVCYGLADFNATNPPGKTPATGSGTATERADTGNGSSYAVYVADWVGTAAGTFSFGPNNYTSLAVAQVACIVRAPSGTAYTGTPADPVGVTDAASGVTTAARAPADPIGATDSAAWTAATARTAADPVGVADVVTSSVEFSRAPADPVGATDAASATSAADRSQADPVQLTDTASAVATVDRTPADPVGVTDTVSAELVRTAADPVGVTDVVAVELAAVRTAADPVGVTDTASSSQTSQNFTLLNVFALSAADPHNITITGASAGLDLWLLVNTGATVATPSGWTLEASRVAVMGSYLLHLPGESNPGGSIGVTLDLSGARPLSAVSFQAPTLDTSIYASLVAPANTPGSTAWGTDAHTFTARDDVLAVYMFHEATSGTPATFGIASFDNGFQTFADTGWAGTGAAGDEAARVIVGSASSIGFTAGGVVLTLDAAGPTGSAVGFVAFNLDSALFSVKADPIGITDSVAQVATVVPSLTDPVGSTDSAIALQDLARSTADPVGLVDTVTADLSGVTARTAADPVGVSDTAGQVVAAARGPADPVGVTDTATPAVDYVRAVADAVGVADTGSPQTIDIVYGLDDPTGVTDTAGRVAAIDRSQADPVGVTDTATVDSTGATIRTPADPVGISDTAGQVVAGAQTAADPVGVADTVTVALAQVVTVADLLGLIDAAAPAAGPTGTPADPVGVTDAVAAVQARTVPAGDPVGVTDAVTAVATMVRTAPDLVGVTDSASSSTPAAGAAWTRRRAGSDRPATAERWRAGAQHPTTTDVT